LNSGQLNLERLAQLERENKQQEGVQQAGDKSYRTIQTPTSTDEFSIGSPTTGNSDNIDTSVQFDPDLYYKNLQAVDPKLAQQFQASKQTLDIQQQELEKKQLDNQLEKSAMPLKLDILRHQGVNEAYTYGEATNFKDLEGFKSLFNKYMD
jgi:hypothetical protein